MVGRGTVGSGVFLVELRGVFRVRKSCGLSGWGPTKPAVFSLKNRSTAVAEKTVEHQRRHVHRARGRSVPEDFSSRCIEYSITSLNRHFYGRLGTEPLRTMNPFHSPILGVGL